MKTSRYYHFINNCKNGFPSTCSSTKLNKIDDTTLRHRNISYITASNVTLWSYIYSRSRRQGSRRQWRVALQICQETLLYIYHHHQCIQRDSFMWRVVEGCWSAVEGCGTDLPRRHYYTYIITINASNATHL